MNPEGRIVQILARASGAVRRDLLRGGRRGLRQGRRHHLPRPDLRRRPRRQGGEARRQGRPRDGPLPHALPSKARASSPRSSASAGSRASTRSRSSAPSTSPTPSTTTSLDEARQQAQHFSEDEIGERLDLRDVLTVTIDPATARDFDDAISLSRDDRGLLEPGRPHRRRLALRPAGSALDRTGAAARHQRLPARPGDPDAPGDPLQQPGQPPGQPRPLHRQRPDGVQRRGHPAPTAGSPGRPSASTTGSPTKQAMAVMKHPGRQHPGVAPSVAAMLGADARAGDDPAHAAGSRGGAWS